MLFLLPNVVLVTYFFNLSLQTTLHVFVTFLTPEHCLVWLTTNLMLVLAFLILRRHIFYPIAGIAKQIHGMLSLVTQEAPPKSRRNNIRALARDMARITQLAQDYYHKHQNAQSALIQAREALTQIAAQQHRILVSTSREMMMQYQSVLAYANYLEEQIAHRAIDPILRYDFDDVSESGFNLKLIAGALDLMKQANRPANKSIDVPMLIQQTLLALAPSLDRRSMKLTTIEVDLGVIARSDPATVAHVLWMMLFGTIRYAAEESTMRMRCLYNHDRTQCLLSIVVSQLSPGRMTYEERSTFLEHQRGHLSPHMFAETIRIHANMQLAEMLMQRLDGNIAILPLTSYSCEICLTLPAAA